MNVAAVALGSNLKSAWGGREEALWEAVRRIGELGVVRAVSGFYDTTPVGDVNQPRFLNGALLLDTELGAEKLLYGLLDIERAMGRTREGISAKGPRVIDLDLLLFGDFVMQTAALTLPHPSMRVRRFVLEPLAEIAGEMIEPVSGMTVQEILDATPA